MDKQKQNALEAAGFRFGDAADFLGLTEEEKMMVLLRLRVSRKVKLLREMKNLSQHQLAAKINSSQSRIAKMEAGASGISLDLLFKGLFAVGGRIDDLTGAAKAKHAKAKTSMKASTTISKRTRKSKLQLA